MACLWDWSLVNIANRAAGAANLPGPTAVGGMPAHIDCGSDFCAWANEVERPFRED
jgi:hypothetical protein